MLMRLYADVPLISKWHESAVCLQVNASHKELQQFTEPYSPTSKL